ncbi:MAG: DUF721 domain-containing protein [Candidatus Omnitrophica bacterium]|nr:DUF721 domain-containing protein [Candidatus Omnitrophota bacterium]
MKSDNMESIKAILHSVFKNLEEKQGQHPKEGFEALWEKCCTKKTAKHTTVSFFKNGTIYINAENSGWLYALKIKREEILKKLRKISKNKIKDIRLRVGDIKK